MRNPIETNFKDCRALFAMTSAKPDEYPPCMEGEYDHLVDDGTGLGNDSFEERGDGRQYTDVVHWG
jgi:hypothetical protein